jgi:hypothetical protein
LPSPTLKQSVLRYRHTVSGTEVEKCVDNEQDLWKSNSNFVKDVPIMCAHFITIVITVFEKNIGGIAFVPPAVFMWAVCFSQPIPVISSYSVN